MGHDLAQAALAARQAALAAADDAIVKTEANVSRLRFLLDRREAANRAPPRTLLKILEEVEGRWARLHQQRPRLLAKLP